ncbi:MAG: energy transducer TonB [Proteobacteria bacterium]|nr:energy transducer TonB [Pseudomonadota bacterium]
MTSYYYSRSGPDTLSWGRVCGIAFAITVQASLFMMLLVPPSADNQSKDDTDKPRAVIIQPPPKPPPPPPPPPKDIKTPPPPKDVPPPPKQVATPPPPVPPPQVITNQQTLMTPPAAPPAPPAKPPPITDVGGSVDISFMRANPPEYPPKEMSEGVTGTVTLVCRVSAEGVPESCNVEKDTSHNRNLQRAAKDAAMKWRYNPTVKNGVKVEDYVRVPVEFKL